ncbi:VOC family protein [Azohydromonas caseinilytica]|uniref:VOC family protein n=1 Tax=Azohydromonas caseinilytica TaxID=2728836 RepID=A0A848FHY4_9BURK|nr:VOC family protein [Azohydromonas caseinilytica]NML17820.1 VOC family protein [Azohydromonas caseinilytica]
MQILVNIDVDDLQRAAAFYGAAFGLTRGRRLGPDVVELLGGSSPLYLLRKSAGTVPAPRTAQRRDYRRHWTPVHLDFVVADIQAAVQQALAAGATLEQPVTGFAWGHLATFADPFGHGFCLVQFTESGYDAIAG